MSKILITEEQLKKITKNLMSEAVGVPEGVTKSADELYGIVSNLLKSITHKDNEYEFDVEDVNLDVSNIEFDSLNLTVQVEEVDEYDGKAVIASMGVGNRFKFDDSILMQINFQDKSIELSINFIVSNDWEPNELYDSFTEDEVHTTSVMAHELKHRFDRSKKRIDLLGRAAKYQTYSSGTLNFGIPVINEFMMYSYYMNMVESLVRPTEVATRMIKKGVTRNEFYDFIVNDETFIKLKSVKEFTFDYLITSLYEQMDRVDALISHAGGDPGNMTEKQKVKSILELVYINLVNTSVEMFDKFFYDGFQQLNNLFGGLFGTSLPGTNVNKEKENVRKKFVNSLTKYENRPLDFFKDRCDNFQYESTKLMKKISKIYSLIPDEKQETNESIINWDLHQKIMEKKYGRTPIKTTYNFKK